MQTLSGNSPLPWLLIGDFNNIIDSSEKMGLNPQPSWLIDGFRQVIEDYQLNDLGMEGYEFTWSQSRGAPNCVEECLDRGLCSYSWRQQFRKAKISNWGFFSSDHSALLMELVQQSHIRRSNIFKFENAWIKERDCRDVI